MRRWLACLGLCCAIAACDGGADNQDDKTGQPEPATSDPTPTMVTSGVPTTPTLGIGDGEIGTSVSDSNGKAPAGSHVTAAGKPASGSGSTVGAGATTSPTASAPTSTSGSAAGVTSSAHGDVASSASDATSSVSVPPSSEVSTIAVAPAQSGTLTAGTWDDNRNFERFSAYRADPVRKSLPGVLPLTDDEFAAAHAVFSQPATARAQLDVALVIDTTGSMGDELSYLQTEFVAISRSIEAKYPNAAQRWALVLYKDVGDEYLTRYFDFRVDAEEFRKNLAAQSAGGGGDFPESPEAAFEVLNQLGWRSDAGVAKLAFWVADAPHHDQNAAKFAETLRTAHGQNIHVYPVASSGVNDFTELTMRSAAQLTGGRYMFLTSDSGVGGAHKEPTIPCYFVTKLDDAILRMVDIELTGSYREPEAAKVIRTSGDPAAGICTLASGQTVQVF